MTARRREGSVLVYHGKRGKTFGIRYRDADGRRVSETLGSEHEGWDRKRAAEALEERRVAVRKDGRRRLEPTTFATFAREWLKSYPDAKDLKRSTRQGYESIVELHLIPELGRLQLAAIDARELDRYLAHKQGLAPRTRNRHLNLLHSLFKAAEARGLVRSNPVSAVERPREPRRRWRILTPAEIGAVERAFVELVDVSPIGEERAWLDQARVVFLTTVSAGLRCGEVLGLRWKDVALADPAGATLRVRETFVRGQSDTPKSERSERTLSLGWLASELFDHRGRTRYSGDDERVFCNPRTGGVLDERRYAVTVSGRARPRRDHRLRSPLPRPATREPDERRGGRNVGAGANGAGWTLRLQDDAALHRPGRRDIPRGGGEARREAVRAEVGPEVAASSPSSTTERPAPAGLFPAMGRFSGGGGI